MWGFINWSYGRLEGWLTLRSRHFRHDGSSSPLRPRVCRVMSDIRFGFTNLIDAAALTAGSEAAGLEITNLQDPIGSPSVAWQTLAGDLTAADGAYFVCDAGYTATINGLVLARGNLSATAQFLFRSWQSATMLDDSLSYSTGWLSGLVIPTIGQL